MDGSPPHVQPGYSQMLQSSEVSRRSKVSGPGQSKSLLRPQERFRTESPPTRSLPSQYPGRLPCIPCQSRKAAAAPSQDCLPACRELRRRESQEHDGATGNRETETRPPLSAISV